MNNPKSALANSGLMLLLYAIPIVIVSAQAIIFLARAWKEGENLGISRETRKKVVVNSLLLSIVPSLPIIMAVMLPFLGKYLRWLRLSVIASVDAKVAGNNAAIDSVRRLTLEAQRDLERIASGFEAILGRSAAIRQLGSRSGSCMVALDVAISGLKH